MNRKIQDAHIAMLKAKKTVYSIVSMIANKVEEHKQIDTILFAKNFGPIYKNEIAMQS
jgi:hypothetical protein